MKQTFNLAVVVKGSHSQYWKSAHAGTIKAEEDLLGKGTLVKLIRKSPLREDDREDQVKIVMELIEQGIQGIILSPCDNRLMVAPIEKAAQVDIPTVVIDSALDTSRIVSFIATDNKKAGSLAADRMGQILGGKGRVLVLRYLKGSASTTEREEAFISRIKHAFSEIELVLPELYAGATRDSARAVSETLLTRFHDLRGIFTPNEPSTAGMLMALEATHKAGKTMLVGFDASNIYLDCMRHNKIHGLVVQDPFRMGELGVKTMVDHLQGKPVPQRIDTGATLVTPENLSSPAIQKLIRSFNP